MNYRHFAVTFTSRILALTTLLLLPQISGAAENGPDVRRAYVRSQDTPDAIAFQEYLKAVNHEYEKSPETAAEFVSFSLRLGGDAKAAELAEEATSIFESAHKELNQAMLSSDFKNLCGPEKGKRSEDEIYEVMDRLDDQREMLMQQQFDRVKTRPGPGIRDMLVAHLADVKKSMFYVAMNHKKAWEESGRNTTMAQIVEEICQDLSVQLER